MEVDVPAILSQVPQTRHPIGNLHTLTHSALESQAYSPPGLKQWERKASR